MAKKSQISIKSKEQTFKTEKSVKNYNVKDSQKGSSPKRTKSTDDFSGSSGSLMTRDDVVLPNIEQFNKKHKAVGSMQLGQMS